MKRRSRQVSLSPNEATELVREELHRRRKLRLQQVRDQERRIALQVRCEVRNRREQELHKLQEKLKETWQEEQQDLIRDLQLQYVHCQARAGTAQRSASENQPDSVGLAQKEEDQWQRAYKRHTHALRELQHATQAQQEQDNRPIWNRRKALLLERERSAKVASMPPPPPNPIENIGFMAASQLVRNMEDFSVSRHHRHNATVDREDPAQQRNAQGSAAVETARLKVLSEEEARGQQEQLEKACLRGGHALRKERLQQERECLLLDLERLQALERLRCRQVLHLRPHIEEAAQDRNIQKEIEHAFEDLYTSHIEVKTDVAEFRPIFSPIGHGNDLDLTSEEEIMKPQSLASPSCVDVPVRHPLKHGLCSLLQRIKTQREKWSTAAEVLPCEGGITEKMPSEDAAVGSLSIGTGILRYGERESETTLPPNELSFPHSGAQVDGMEGRAQDTQSWLKEQSSSLLEAPSEQQAQVENSCVVPWKGPKEEMATQAHSTDSTDHIARIQHYQQGLLEQSRLQRQCVQVASQQLEEYQSMLRQRYSTVSMPTGTTLPAISMVTTHPPFSAAFTEIAAQPSHALVQGGATVISHDSSVAGEHELNSKFHRYSQAAYEPSEVNPLTFHVNPGTHHTHSPCTVICLPHTDFANTPDMCSQEEAASSSVVCQVLSSDVADSRAQCEDSDPCLPSTSVVPVSSSEPVEATHASLSTLLRAIQDFELQINSHFHSREPYNLCNQTAFQPSSSEPHQLSSIPEVDTLLNSSISAADNSSRLSWRDTFRLDSAPLIQDIGHADQLSTFFPAERLSCTTISTGSYCTSSAASGSNLYRDSAVEIGLASQNRFSQSSSDTDVGKFVPLQLCQDSDSSAISRQSDCQDHQNLAEAISHSTGAVSIRSLTWGMNLAQSPQLGQLLLDSPCQNPTMSHLMGQALDIESSPQLDEIEEVADSFLPLMAELTLSEAAETSVPLGTELCAAFLRVDPSTLSSNASEDLSHELLHVSTSDHSAFLSSCNPEPEVHSLSLSSATKKSGMVDLPLWERILEVYSGRGILEESALSLVSLTNSSLEPTVEVESWSTAEELTFSSVSSQAGCVIVKMMRQKVEQHCRKATATNVQDTDISYRKPCGRFSIWL
ncbi:uncharacterized protein cep295 isoform X2 [Denticeps clupeoides]|uniref:uncharacterized protein cep295 isoform X2 n=1 Tax=Denticeps clupeoides TaxID=299321 RepID=UPI0010A4F628|nr:centrosomal protein of 295 kDa isoform X2 [Denticeps clupeoides]